MLCLCPPAGGAAAAPLWFALYNHEAVKAVLASLL
jgi:hypothetical protein